MMADLSDFPVSRRWPATDPTRLQLYSQPSPNGVKVSIMLEEIGLPYEPHRIPFGDDGTRSAEFLALNPNGKIPAIVDPDGPGGRPLGLFESGAIMLYLAEKTGQLLPDRPGPAAGSHSMAAVAEFVHRADFRPGRLLQQVRRPRIRRQAAAPALCRGKPPPARRARPPPRRPRLGDGRLFDRRHRDARLGAQSDRLLRSARRWSASTLSPMSPPGSTGGLARPAVQRGLSVPAG